MRLSSMFQVILLHTNSGRQQADTEEEVNKVNILILIIIIILILIITIRHVYKWCNSSDGIGDQ